MIEVEDLSKDYGGLKALEGVTLRVKEGETLGLIGPNGAGKTTLIRILTGQIPPTGGRILLDGKPVDPRDRSYRLRVGLVPQEPSFYGRLTAMENLRLLGELYRLSGDDLQRRCEALLSLVGLREDAHRQVRHFSGGMRQRLSVAMGLVHDPEIVYLDEPTSGLDPAARTAVWSALGLLSEEGKTVILTTHFMEEADRLCHRIALLVHGRIRRTGTPEEVKEILGKDRLEIRLRRVEGKELDRLCRELNLHWEAVEEGMVILRGPDLADKIPRLSSALSGSIVTLHYRETTLEDAFVRFVEEVGD